MSNLPTINFASIRPLGGKQTDGFEQLSVQLFHGEYNGQGQFFSIDGSGGDGGVEAYIVRSDQTKVAVQSKYFDKLGQSQWTQITKSVKSALENHPTLRTYIVVTPLDRNPTQVKKWNALTNEWQDHAKKLGIIDPINFVWWGYTELTMYLTKGTYRNQLVYWLGVPDFSMDWLNEINQSNIKLLGRRYSPKQNIKTESGTVLDAFAWGEDGKNRIIETWLKVSEKWRTVDSRDVAKGNISSASKNMTNEFREIMGAIISFRWPSSGYPLIRPLNESCLAAVEACQELEWKLHALNQEEKDRQSKERSGHAGYQSFFYDSLLRDLSQLGDAIKDLTHETNRCLVADDSCLLLLGDAGSGKSHLIADLVTSATSRSQPALLLLGECYLGNDDPWTSTVRSLGWRYCADDLLAALDQEAQLAGRPALLCIDALNESEHRRLWQSHLIEFSERVSRYPHVKLLVSCRSDFANITLPEMILQGSKTAWSSVVNRGYGVEVIDAIEVYFSEFDIRAPYFPPGLAEFRNPLFLRLFCEAFAGLELPKGPLGLDQVMQTRIDRLCTQIRKEIDCDPEDTRAALKAIAADIAKAGGRPVPRKKARDRAREHFPNPETSKSLYARLLSNGMLVETSKYAQTPTQEDEVMVSFPFERFSDYFIAHQVLDGIGTADQFKELFEEGSRLAHLNDCIQYYDNRGIARALAILVPERLGLEFAEALPEPKIRKMVIEDFLESMAWRSSSSFTNASKLIVDEAQQLDLDLLTTYIRLSTIPQHPFNSEYLGSMLASLRLPEREIAWTIPVAELSVSGDDSILEEFLDWGFRAPVKLIPDGQALLAGRLLLWFCTSNHRALRKRSTIAAIRLLVDRPQVIRDLIAELQAVDDPYLLERLYAVASGVAMRLPAGAGLASLASDVHSAIFAQDQVTPNILIRDFASNVLEVSLEKGCLPPSINANSFRPPFKTQWPTIMSEDDVKRLEEDESWDRIVSSVRTESMGRYGDFGRYIMGTEVHNFSDKLLSDIAPSSSYLARFPSTIARCWVLQRVEELGWTGERFAEHECSCLYGRQRHDDEELKLERISKKYQWIALSEFTGFLADHYWLDHSCKDRLTPFEGAWQTCAREFDPSQRLIDLGYDEPAISNTGKEWEKEYPNLFDDHELCADRGAWVAQQPPDFASLLRIRHGLPNTQHQWLVLAGHHEWVEPEYNTYVSGYRGILKMWVNVRSFLMRKEDRNDFVARASQKHFNGFGCTFPDIHSGWIGEYPWGKAFSELRSWCEEPDVRVGDVDVSYAITACDWSSGSTLIPSPQLCDMLQFEWAGVGAKFCDKNGEEIIDQLGKDTTENWRPLLVRQDSLKSALDAAGLEIVWCVIAERSCWCSETNTYIGNKIKELSAVYFLDRDSIKGGISQMKLQEIGARDEKSCKEELLSRINLTKI